MQPRHFISLGAGVQSTVMTLMADKGELSPRPEAAIFADTGWEPKQVYEHLDWLETECSIPIIRLTDRNLYNDLLTFGGDGRADWRRGAAGYAYTDIPAHEISTKPGHEGKAVMGQRQCTKNYKIEPIRREVRRLLGYGPKSRIPAGTANQWIGISTDEWMRMKPSGVKYIENIWPLIDAGMSRADCVRWFSANYPGQPLAKSSCIGCPYHSDRQWLDLAKADPDGMERTIALDEWLRDPARTVGRIAPPTEYLHKSRTPLRDALERLQRQEARSPKLIPDDDGIGNECTGYCWT